MQSPYSAIYHIHLINDKLALTLKHLIMSLYYLWVHKYINICNYFYTKTLKISQDNLAFKWNDEFHKIKVSSLMI